MSLDLSLNPVAATAFTEAALQGLLDLGLALLDTLPERPQAPAPRTHPPATRPRPRPPAPSEPPRTLQVSWTRGKGDTETKLWKATHNGEPWIARVTHVADIPYDALRHSLMVNKTATEQATLLAKGDEITAEAGGGRRFGDIAVLGELVPSPLLPLPPFPSGRWMIDEGWGTGWGRYWVAQRCA